MSTPRLSFGNAKLGSKFCEDLSETFRFMKTIFFWKLINLIEGACFDFLTSDFLISNFENF